MKNNFPRTNETSNFQNIPGRDLHKEKCLFYSKIPKMNVGDLLKTILLCKQSFFWCMNYVYKLKKRLAWEFVHLLWLFFTSPKSEENKEGQRRLSNTSQWQLSLAIPVWLEQEIRGHSSLPGSFSSLQINTQSLPTLVLPCSPTCSESAWILPFSPLSRARWRRTTEILHVESPVSGQI